jgi:hypothetical protein
MESFLSFVLLFFILLNEIEYDIMTSLEVHVID